MKCSCHSHNGFLLSSTELAQQETLGLCIPCGVVAPGEDQLYLDKVGSVSGLVEVEDHWDADLIDQQYQRFLNGW